MPRKREDDSFVARILSKKPPLFWWFLVNTTAFCMAVLSWIFFLQVFGNPHHPRNYELLAKMGRLQQPTPFDSLNAPKGLTFSPRTLYKKYYNLEPDDFELLNREFLKVYINNFKDTSYNTYVQGEFRVLKTRTLGSNDFITDGIAIQAQALVQPDTFHPPTPFLVLVELILPGARASAASEYQLGDVLELNKNPYYPSIIHARRITREGDEPLISLTCIPLVSKSKVTPPRGKPFAITTPQRINLSGQLPVFLKKEEAQ